MKYNMLCLLLIAFNFGLSSCAYRLGNSERSLPKSYRQLTIPLFKNQSMEPSVEVAFTNALTKEFERSKVGAIVDPNQAEVTVEGTIRSITYTAGGKKDTGLPSGSVLATTYDIAVSVGIVVRKRADLSVIWSGDFSRTRSYSAPQVTLSGINTVNPLYNSSAKRQNLELMAADMMAEAHDRLTENF